MHTLIQAPRADSLQLKARPLQCLSVFSPGTDVNLNLLILDDPKWTVGICSLLLVQNFIMGPVFRSGCCRSLC